MATCLYRQAPVGTDQTLFCFSQRCVVLRFLKFPPSRKKVRSVRFAAQPLKQ